MRLVIRTADRTISRMCRDSFAILGCGNHEIVDLGATAQPYDADIELLDLGWNSPRNFQRRQTARTVFICLIERDQMEEFLNLASSRCWALLKPVTAPMLTATLRHALEAANDFNLAVSYPTDARLLRSGARAYLDLQAYDQDRTRFLARAAHDFKGPLSAVNGFCELLLKGEVGTLGVRQKHAVATMQKSVDRLNRLAQDLFDISVQVVLDRARPMQVGDLAGVINESITDLLPVATTKRINVLMELDVCPELIAFDRTGIERVMLNLIDNARRFTSAKGSLGIKGYPFFWERRHRRSPFLNRTESRVRDSQRPNCYRVDMHNTGPCIPEEYIAHIFEEYTAAGETPDRHSAGLGLAICRSVLARHAGHIWAENRGDGPVFSFVIPFARINRQMAGAVVDAAVANHLNTISAGA